MNSPDPRMPRNRKGPLHIIDAAGFSIAGFKRLCNETAARLELIISLLFLIGLFGIGASFTQIAIFMMMILALIAVEALNTAVEEIVNHLAPEWALWAKHAKDLGSLAVCAVLLIMGIYLLLILLPRFLT